MYLKHKELVFLVSSTFILVLAWIFFNLYHKSTTSTLTDIQNEQIVPINPQFDTKTVDQLKQRKQAESVEQIQQLLPTTNDRQPTPTILPTNVPTASSTPTLVPSISTPISPTSSL